MAITLFARNLLEDATVTCAAVEATPLARLYDRGLLPYAPAFPQAWAPFYDIAPLPLALAPPALAQIDIDIDLGSAQAVSAWALVHHNLAGITVTLFGDNTSPATTSRDSFTPAGADVLRAFAAQTLRYWRVRIPAMATAPEIGELLLGVPRVIGQNPHLDSAGRTVLGNVARDYSPAKHPHATQLGPARTRLAWTWPSITAGDEAARAGAVTETDEGAKPLLVRDEDAVLRWMEIVDPSWEPRPVVPSPTIGGESVSARLTLEEVPR